MKKEKITYSYAQEMAEYIVTGISQKIIDIENEQDRLAGENLDHGYDCPIKISPQTDYITTDYITEDGAREGYPQYNDSLSQKEQIQLLTNRIYKFLD